MKHRRQVASVPSKGQIPRCPLSADSRHWSLLSTSPRGTWGAPEGAKCLQCHKAMNPALTEEWHAGAHGQKGVNCYDCHRAEKTDVDAFEHNGATISVIVSPQDCGRCHQKEVDQQKGSHHAKAGENRAKSDGIDAELLLRTLLAWLRGEPRVCSMVPIPDETDEVPDGVFASGPNSSPSASV